ncbi:MAG TPA: beta-propeller fold lactonase family protein [Methylophilaceae bacterium]
MRNNKLPLLLSTLLLPLGISLATPAFAADKGLAYVSDQDGGVTVIDLNTMMIEADLGVGGKGPRGIGITPDGKLLITANKDDGNISVIDTLTGRVARHVSIGKNPEFVRVYGNHAFVTYEPSASPHTAPAKRGRTAAKDDDEDKIPGRIAIVDLKKGRVISEIIGKPETEGLEFSKNGKQLLVTNESDNSISVHDIATGKLLRTVEIGKYGERPRGIKMSPDGKYYAVTLEASDKLLLLNSKLEPVKAVATGKSPYGVAYDRSGRRLFVASSKQKILRVYNVATMAKLKDIPTGERCWHFSFSPDDKDILLACGKSGEIVVVDADKLEVTKRISDPALPWGIVTYPKAVGSLDMP